MTEPLFDAGATRRFRAVLIGLPAMLIATLTLLMLYQRTPAADGRGQEFEQPIIFDHRHHVHDAGMDCLFCHRDAARQAHAGMPDSELCMRCHQQVLSDSPKLRPLQRHHRQGVAIPWRRVHDLPDFVFFHHGAHVAAGVSCQRCHGSVEDMASVRQVRPLQMGWCLDCHEHPEIDTAERDLSARLATRLPSTNRRQPTDGPLHCSACHR